MERWDRVVASAGEGRIIVSIGLLEIVMAVARIALRDGDNPFTSMVATDMLIVLPGLVLVYGGYRLPNTNLRSEAYPRVVARCFAGIGVMLGVVAVLAVTTGLNRPIFTPMAGTALGSVAGFAVGVNEARALSRAYEAEQAHREAERRGEELRHERTLRERIVETSPVGIAVVDSDGSITFANEHAADVVGLPEAEVTDLRYDESVFREDGDDSPDDSVFERILTTGEPVYKEERRITRPDGQQRWLSVNGTPLYDRDGDLISVIFAFEDVTERTEHERELEESNERLEQFAYAASHDLQEPLRMVSSYLQLLEKRYGDDLDQDAREFIDFAVDGADRMRAMIESLLEYSRVTTGGKPLEPTDTENVLEDALDDLHLRIEETDATVTTDELPAVNADADQLGQVFQNLLSNALTYSGDEYPEVHVSAERSGDAWQFTVADRGIGIDPDHHDRIFEVFERLHGDEDEVGEEVGGIGLALCERIVDRHGGDIWLDSTPGEGTTFYFTMPAIEGRQPERAA